MSVGVQALFTNALGLQVPWVVEDVKLDTPKRRIDFEIACQGAALPCPRPGSGFTAAFEALALALCRELPVRQAAALRQTPPRCARRSAQATRRRSNN